MIFFARECGSESRDDEPAADESGVRLATPLVIVEAAPRVGVTVTRAGFEILNAAGEVIAWREHFEEALFAQRDLDGGEDVRRVSDGAVCATKHRIKGDHLFAAIWNMKTEPEWQP